MKNLLITICFLAIEVLPVGAQQTTQKIIIDEGKMTELNDLLKIQTDIGRFSGSAIVAQDGKPIFVYASGMANKRFEVPNKLDTKFNLGSLNKMFTAVAILQLVETGKIGIDDPIAKYLDNFPSEVSQKVTIRQLLNMSNGWGDYWQNRYYLAYKDRLRSVSDYIGFIKDIPLQFDPGTNIIHSNIGFEVAGAIIEKVSGMDYFEYIREYVYKPAGMVNSDSYDRDAPVENMAVGYTDLHPLDTKRKGFNWENTYILSPRGTPAGGGYSTAEDMLKYDMAIRSNRLIGEEYVHFMSNGFKGNIGDSRVKTIDKSAGGISGVSTFYVCDWEYCITLIVLTNVDHPVAIDLGNEILKILGFQ